MHDNITDYVVSTAERIEDMESIDDLDPLDVELKVGLDGTVREVILILTIGAPHVEVNVSNGTVFGSWGGETHTTHVNNDDLLDHAHDHYAELFDERH